MSFGDRYSFFAFHCVNGSSLHDDFLDAKIKSMILSESYFGRKYIPCPRDFFQISRGTRGWILT